MKKVILILAALLLVGATAFAADIAGDKLGLKASVSASAQLIWGVSMDDQSAAETGIQYASGFKNVISGDVKLTLIAKQTLQNSGTGPVYAEIQIADIGMALSAGGSPDAYEAILSKITAKLNIGPVFINILGDSHSCDMAFFGQKLVSGREDKRGIYTKLDNLDTQNDQKGAFKGLSIGLTDARFVKVLLGISSAGIWTGVNTGSYDEQMIARAPIVVVTEAGQSTSSSNKVPLGKVYYLLVPGSGNTNAAGTVVKFDTAPGVGTYAILDADEFYNKDAVADSNSENVYNIFLSLGLGDEIAASTGLTFDIKAAMTTYQAAGDKTFKNSESGFGGQIGYKLPIAPGYSVEAKVGVDWKNTAFAGSSKEAPLSGYYAPGADAGMISGSKDEIVVGGGVRMNMPGNAMNETNSAEYWGVAKKNKLNIYPGFALGFQGYTAKNATTSGAWRPAVVAYGASFYDAKLIPIVDVVALWNTQWDSMNVNANGAGPGIWELGLRVGATVDIFTPYVEYYHFQNDAYINGTNGAVNSYNVGWIDQDSAWVTSAWAGGVYTTLKVGVDIAPFKLTTFGVAYESGNLAMTHNQYTIGGANSFWGNLQLNVKISL